MKDLTGQRFGRLVVIKPEYKKNRRWYWLCKCDCGNEKIIRGSHIGKATKSCGCLSKELTIERNKNHITHNMAHTRIYGIWSGIKQRCENKNGTGFKHYGGRGIMMCKEWEKDFMSFYKWAIKNGYNDYLTIDRIDVNGNYEPSNCRWITKWEQSRNTRRSRYITYHGRTQILKDWCKELQLNYSTIQHRIKKMHYTPEQAFETKIGATI